jgi:hypothetical protein
MIQKHILWATFRVVAHIKGECVELPHLPRISFLGGFARNINYEVMDGQMRGLEFSDVLWCG